MLCYTGGNNTKKLVCDGNNNTTNKKPSQVFSRGNLTPLDKEAKLAASKATSGGDARVAQGVTEVREVQQSCRQTKLHHMKLERLMLKTLPVMAAQPFPSK